MIEFLKSLHTADGLRTLIQAGGLFTVVGFVFAETGLLAGFFLPGDSLLVTAGIFASSSAIGGAPLFDFWTLVGLTTAAAIIGDQVGYYLGRKSGPMIYKEKDSFFFKRRHLLEAEEFFKKYGPLAIIAARFVPIFRTFVPFTAGMSQMPFGKFVRYNIFGGIFWVFSMCGTGYYLGQTKYADQLHKVILIVIFVSILPIIVGVGKRTLSTVRASSASQKK